MRSISFVALVALTCSLLFMASAAEARNVTGLDGQTQLFEFTKSVPGQLNYQGFLADAADSSAVTTTLEMTFRLFDSEIKGAELWAETHPAVGVHDGLFQVLLGSITSFPTNLFDGNTRWLQTEVGAEVLSPRKPLVSTAYSQKSGDADHATTTEWATDAQHAIHADTATYSQSGGGWTVDGDNVYRMTGKVGIGTASPLTELDVSGSVNATTYYGNGSNLTGIAGAPDADWTVAGNHMYSAVPGSVGVGTVSPENKLHVAGDVKATTYYGDGSNLTGISGAPDNDWTVSGNILYPAGDYGLSMRSSNVLHGMGDTTHVNFGIACTTGTSGQDYKYCAVGGGQYNTASSIYATVGGGQNNTASGYRGTVGGGAGNTASGPCATVGGGIANIVSGGSATVGGGQNNTASAYWATVAGGLDNDASGQYAAVGGGQSNTAGIDWATVAGGRYNAAGGNYATMGGGYLDTVNAHYGGIAAGYSNLAGDAATDTAAFVGGGYDNSATAMYATVGGGQYNTASYYSATVGGGRYNTASNNYATVGGGNDNIASGYRATVSGGGYNTASGTCATGSGGYFNTASGDNAAVGGGYSNTASGDNAVVGGGYSNTASGDNAAVGGGYFNTANGNSATVAGGSSNNSDGSYSFTVGFNSNVPSSYSNSAAFNGQTATASGQTRIGALSKASGTFTIDHPTQPMNRILNHYFVESPEMVLIYRGAAIIGSDGRAEVHLPDYFDALNRNPMVQLTGVGTSDVYVSEKVTGNRFVIGGKPGTEVYWTVTGDRKDPSAEITRILMPVEQLKEGDLAGHSLDDDFLATTMSQLERMGQAGKFNFRTQAGREKYERSRQALENPGQLEPGLRD